MGTELKDTFVQAYNDTYDYIDRYLTSKLPTRDLIEDALQSVYLDFTVDWDKPRHDAVFLIVYPY